jgi:hypothetical protein
MKKAGALASALRSSGATVVAADPAAVYESAPVPAPVSVETATPKIAQPSRKGTKPITVHHPEEVRRQLKALAAEQGRNVEDMVAEAFNLLFAKYRKGEIAPVRRPTSS